MIAIKTERTQIHFLSDVLVAVASLDLKVPNFLDSGTGISFNVMKTYQNRQTVPRSI